MPMTVDEQTIVDSLRRIPAERGSGVLRFLETLQATEPAICTGADLAKSGLVGLWGDRDEIGTGQEFAKTLRRQAELRTDQTDVARY